MKPVLQLFVALAVVVVVVVATLYVRQARADRPASATQTAPPAATPVAGAAQTSVPRGEVTIDPRRQQLTGVRVVAARRQMMAPTIRASGIVRYDETRQADVNVKVEGWIRDLYVDYTGQPIASDQPLFTFYSPDLLGTENEYLLALKTRDQLRDSPVTEARERAEQLVASARQRLNLWDLPDADIQKIEDSRQPLAVVTVRSPVTGFVIEKQAIKGMHVMPGQTLYKVADLTVVWVEADVYETEVPLVRVGQLATVSLSAFPNERLAGRVVYIYPFVDEKTRTNKVRYEFANRGGRLKPGMFATVELATTPAAGLVVPLDAVLDSGTEQVVFVAKGNGVFEPRHVKVGRRFSDELEILDGLHEGEEVATGATFFLDAESQLRGALQGFEAPSAHSTPSAIQQLDITLKSNPEPVRLGENQFEVSVKDASGQPVADADVTVQFFMAAMPTMGMPAMKNAFKLTPAGAGIYRGPGEVLMAGQWETTISVARGGQLLGTKRMMVDAK